MDKGTYPSEIPVAALRERHVQVGCVFSVQRRRVRRDVLADLRLSTELGLVSMTTRRTCVGRSLAPGAPRWHVGHEERRRLGCIRRNRPIASRNVVRGDLVALLRGVIAVGFAVLTTVVADRQIPVALHAAAGQPGHEIRVLCARHTLRFFIRQRSQRGIPLCAGVGRGVYLHSRPLAQAQWLHVGSTLSHCCSMNEPTSG